MTKAFFRGWQALALPLCSSVSSVGFFFWPSWKLLSTSSLSPVECECTLACRMSKDEGFSCGRQVWPTNCSSSTAACFICLCRLLFFVVVIVAYFFFTCVYQSFLPSSPKWLACTEVFAFDDFCCTLLCVNFFLIHPSWWLQGICAGIMCAGFWHITLELPKFYCLKKKNHLNCTLRYSHVQFRKWNITSMQLATPGGNLWASHDKPKWVLVQMNVVIFHMFSLVHMRWHPRSILRHLMEAYDMF